MEKSTFNLPKYHRNWAIVGLCSVLLSGISMVYLGRIDPSNAWIFLVNGGIASLGLVFHYHSYITCTAEKNCGRCFKDKSNL